MDCIFCKIIAGYLPAQIIAQTEEVLVIQDRAPKAPIHWLIIPKKHLENITSLERDDIILAGKMLWQAKELAQTLAGSQSFKLITNTGTEAGQVIFHLHFHFLSGGQRENV